MPKRRPTKSSDIARQLQRLYDQVPQMECVGECADTCTEFPVPRIERRRVAKAGYQLPIDPLPHNDDSRKRRVCPALVEGRCAVYAVRPLMCRIWGASEIMRCDYGCRPVGGGRLLTFKETFALLAQAFELSGQRGQAANFGRVLHMSPEEEEQTRLLAPLMDALSHGMPMELAVKLREAVLRRHRTPNAG